ncbi:E3 ubiquitin-protein ligase ATL23-like [Ipomoea triloba]|uniref:E3 ubiquitin-protein ligase ATL23-like n=1 Tax=Ipomoea triloba TaxID=35885 RepID=UPI00125CE9B8|nr:E3 ubiquitin-protein ligase ATL23-like [Ipomoea triloba]
MLFSVFLALFLPCAGMSVVLVVYFCLLWYAATYNAAAAAAGNGGQYAAKSTQQTGLSATQLEKLPKVTGKDLVLGNDCAVCLDNIGSDEPARLVPGCNHGFHLECADTWLAKHPVCPICRTKLGPELFDPPEANPC